MRRKEYKFSLIKYDTPSQFKKEFYDNDIRFANYELWAKDIGVLKFGKMTEEERIARQVEGLWGWRKHYSGTSARQLRRKLQNKNLYETITKNDVIVTVYDYTEWFKDNINRMLDADRLLLNQEDQLIKDYCGYYGNTPVLNIQSTRTHYKPLFNKLFEIV